MVIFVEQLKLILTKHLLRLAPYTCTCKKNVCLFYFVLFLVCLVYNNCFALALYLQIGICYHRLMLY